MPKRNKKKSKIKKIKKKTNIDEIIKLTNEYLSEETNNNKFPKTNTKEGKKSQSNSNNNISKNRHNNEISKDISLNNNISNVINRIDYIDEVFKNNININNINNIFKDIIIKKENLTYNMVRRTQISPDGNCFYRAISMFLYATEEKYQLIRMAIYTYALSNKAIILDFQPTVELINGQLIDINTYITYMNTNKFWAGDIEINIACYIFNIAIAIYKPVDEDDINENFYENYLNFNIENNDSFNKPILILALINNNHFDVIYFSDEYLLTKTNSIKSSKIKKNKDKNESKTNECELVNDVFNNTHNNNDIKSLNLNNIYNKKQSEYRLKQFHINIINEFRKIRQLKKNNFSADKIPYIYYYFLIIY